MIRRRFRETLDRPGDGRNLAEGRAGLLGLGAGQEVKEALSEPFPARSGKVTPPVEDTRDAGSPTYYGQPAVKRPVWIGAIPLYFYTGGVTGALGTLAAAAQVSGGPALRPVVVRLRQVVLGGAAMSAALLVYDLGRPSRFLNMLRVFRPTSPMSVGSWLLAGVGACSGAAALFSRGPRALRAVGDVAGLGAGVLGLPFTGYTAVLLSNSAVPAWQAARRTLPPLFIASSVSSAGALLQLWDLGPAATEVGRRYALMGTAAGAVFHEAVTKEIALPEVRRPLQEGRAGRLWKASRLLGLASLGLSLVPSRVRWAQRTAGLLGTAAALATKYAVFYAGRPSATDPRATFEMQRQGRGAAEVTRPSTLVQLKVEGRPLSAG